MPKLSRRQRSLIATILTIAAAGWIAFTLSDSLNRLPASVGALNLMNISLAVMPAIVSVFIIAYTYFLVLSGTVPYRLSFRDVAPPFLVTQAVRYLPGRVWGVFYLAQSTTQWIPAKDALRANIVHYALTTLNSVVIAASIYAFYRKGILFALFVFAILIFLLYLLLKSAFLQRIVARFSANQEYRRDQGSKDLLLLSLLQMDWLLYIVTCVLILPGHYTIGDSTIVAAAYAVAWMAGALAVVLPGGVFVREGSFLWLSGLLGFNPADMFLFSVVARILFALGDVACAAIGVGFMRGKKSGAC